MKKWLGRIFWYLLGVATTLVVAPNEQVKDVGFQIVDYIERLVTGKGPAIVWLDSSSRAAGTTQTLTLGNVEYKFCWIPAGEFDMGSPSTEEGRFSREKQHRVKLTKGFWILETEVTQELYREIAKTNPSNFKGDNLPVEKVTWNDAIKFCEELTKRLPRGVKATLPTEAQWEFSCRAGSKTAYWYGDSAEDAKMNFGQSLLSGGTKPVKSYPANDWGLYDMHGNVWEWTLDRYGDYPEETDPYAPLVDPKGASSDSDPVVRGGGWDNGAGYCRSANRLGSASNTRGADLGFRCVVTCNRGRSL